LPLVPDRVLRGHRDAIISIDWSPDGRLLAGGGRDQAVHVWDLASGRRVGGGVLDSWVKLVRFMDDQRVLASTRTARTSLVDWRSARLGPVVSPGAGTAGLTSIAVSPDRKRLADARGKQIWLQDIATGARIDLVDPPPDVKNIAFSPDGAHVVVTSSEGVLGIWRADNGRVVMRRQLGERPSDLALSPDGRWLAVQTGLGGLLLWDRQSNDLQAVPTDGLSVGRQAFTGDSRRVVYTLSDAGIRVFDTLDQRSRTLRGHRSPITDLVASPDQTSMASGDEGGFVRIWNLRTGDASVLPPLTGPIRRLAFSPSGDRLAAAGNDSTIEIWKVPGQTPSGAGSGTWLRAHTSAEVDDAGLLRTRQPHSAADPR
jgi:WD40 repeat protein